MEKDVCNWYVILMEESWRTWISCCISILLESMECKIVDIVQVECYFELVFLHVFYNKKLEGIPLNSL